LCMFFSFFPRLIRYRFSQCHGSNGRWEKYRTMAFFRRLPTTQFYDSQFINAAAGKVLAGVGHSLLSATATVEPITIPYPREPSRQIIFVDTPGFDDTYIDDSRILKLIADWLAKS
jgi:hypothetical protein